MKLYKHRHLDGNRSTRIEIKTWPKGKSKVIRLTETDPNVVIEWIGYTMGRVRVPILHNPTQKITSVTVIVYSFDIGGKVKSPTRSITLHGMTPDEICVHLLKKVES